MLTKSLKSRVLLVLAMCVMCATVLAGCSANNAESEAQTQNRQYMTSVNQVMEDLSANMEEFTTAVQDGEVIALSSQLDSVTDAVEQLKALSVPDVMKDIHAQYVAGAEELQTALQLYVQLYEDVQAPASGSFDYGTYADRLAEVQSHYDAGIAALQDADTKVSQA